MPEVPVAPVVSLRPYDRDRLLIVVVARADVPVTLKVLVAFRFPTVRFDPVAPISSPLYCAHSALTLPIYLLPV